jgi:hypothetical protein
VAAKIDLFYEEDGFRVGTSGSLVIGSWPGLAQPRHLDRFREAELDVVGRTDALHLIIALKLQGSGISPEMRTKGEALQREFADKIVGQSVVLTGGGLVAATIRAFASGLNLMSRAKVLTKTFGNPADAIRWFGTLARGPEHLREHVAGLEAAVTDFTTDLYE